MGDRKLLSTFCHKIAIIEFQLFGCCGGNKTVAGGNVETILVTIFYRFLKLFNYYSILGASLYYFVFFYYMNHYIFGIRIHNINNHHNKNDQLSTMNSRRAQNIAIFQVLGIGN